MTIVIPFPTATAFKLVIIYVTYTAAFRYNDDCNAAVIDAAGGTCVVIADGYPIDDGIVHADYADSATCAAAVIDDANVTVVDNDDRGDAGN